MKPLKREIETADMVAETTQRWMIAGMEYGLHGDGVGIHTFKIFVRYSQALSKQNPLSLYVLALNRCFTDSFFQIDVSSTFFVSSNSTT